MNNLLAILLMVVMGGCVCLQALAVVRLFALRMRHGDQPDLEKRPDVKEWARRSLWVFAAAVLSTVGLVCLSHDLPVIVLVTGAPSLLLWIAAATIGDNSSHHGDGDSGG